MTHEKRAALRIFVTGGSGLVGSHLVRYLAQRGHSVVALLRPTSDRTHVEESVRRYPGNVSIEVGDLMQPQLLRQQVSGCDVVVHCAAIIDAFGNPQHLHQVNVVGTHNVLESTLAAHVPQLVYISSLAVITGERDQFGVTEDEPMKPSREVYANSKVEAEKLVRQYFHRSKTAITILRPGFIYGPSEKAWMPRLINALVEGRAMIVGDGTKETNVIYVENLCRAIELSLLNPIAYKRIYNLTDGQYVSKRRLFNTIADELGLPRPSIVIPYAAARALIESAAILARIGPRSWSEQLSKFSRPAFRLAALNQGFDITRAERELGYTNRVDFSEGMAQTLMHWKKTLPQRKAHVDVDQPLETLSATPQN